MTRKKTTVVVALIAIMGVFSYFLLKHSDTIEPSAEGLERITVAQWGQEKYLIYLPLYIAQQEGYFEDEGLDVRILYSGNDDQVFATVLRGDAQFGVADPIFAAISQQKGADGVVIGQIVGKVALWGVARDNNKEIRTPADFAGMKVGTFPRPSTTYTLMANMISTNNVAGARIVEAPIGTEAALLESGRVNVAMMLEPAASIAESKGFHVVTSFPQLWGDFSFTGLTSVASYVKENPSTVAAVRRAFQRGLDLAHSDITRTVQIAQELFPNIDQAVVDRAVRRMIDDETLPSDFTVSLNGWSAAIKIRQEMGELEKDFSCGQCLAE